MGSIFGLGIRGLLRCEALLGNLGLEEISELARKISGCVEGRQVGYVNVAKAKAKKASIGQQLRGQLRHHVEIWAPAQPVSMQELSMAGAFLLLVLYRSCVAGELGPSLSVFRPCKYEMEESC